ncbi:RNA polymerase sigma-70 ECF-like, Rhodopirellula baltica [Rhodopirellula sp. SWK7]|nr:RNA polymerase sigma-70 ECF-like, Rhodopirellula baltica [Rhodopirellula sp. SWK7]
MTQKEWISSKTEASIDILFIERHWRLANSRFSFEDLLEQAQSPVLGYLVRLTGSVHVAQDTLQAANVTALEKQESFQPGTNFAAWLCQIARNHFRNHSRKHTATKAEALVDDRLHDVIERRYRERLAQRRKQSNWERLDRCLQSLPDHQRDLVEGFYLRGHSLTDLAESTGRKPNAIGQALHRARNALVDCVKFQAESTATQNHPHKTPAATATLNEVPK